MTSPGALQQLPAIACSGFARQPFSVPCRRYAVCFGEPFSREMRLHSRWMERSYRDGSLDSVKTRMRESSQAFIESEQLQPNKDTWPVTPLPKVNQRVPKKAGQAGGM